ncbi:MAG: ABC transporter substrate-binding protein [Alphaproteobacteria bacterium]|nr:ABC transporter substrate-binding protein [Alphaproteobacteria bacterium]
MDFCADQLVLSFAERANIVALSEDAMGLHSFYKAKAEGLKVIRSSAEEVLMLKPDLVFRTWGRSHAIDQLYSRVNVGTFQPPFAIDYEAVLNTFTSAAEALGKAEAGKLYVQGMRERLLALQALESIPLKAVYLTPSGFTAGRGTSVDAVIHLAGLDTIAVDLGLNGWGELPLEKLVMTPPDVVIASFFEEGAVHVSNWSSGRHGVFGNLIKDLPSILVPSHLMSCGRMFTVDAAEYIRAEAERLGLDKKLPKSTAPLQAEGPDDPAD